MDKTIFDKWVEKINAFRLKLSATKVRQHYIVEQVDVGPVEENEIDRVRRERGEYRKENIELRREITVLRRENVAALKRGYWTFFQRAATDEAPEPLPVELDSEANRMALDAMALDAGAQNAPDTGLPVRVGDVWKHRYLRLGERVVLERLHDGWSMTPNSSGAPVYMLDHAQELWGFVRRAGRDSPVQNGPNEPNADESNADEPDTDTGLPIRPGDVWRRRFLRLDERVVLERLHDGWRMTPNSSTGMPVYMLDHAQELWGFVRRAGRDSPVQNGTDESNADESNADESNADDGLPIRPGDVWRHRWLGERVACERLLARPVGGKYDGWRMTNPNGAPVYMFDSCQELWTFVRRGSKV